MRWRHICPPSAVNLLYILPPHLLQSSSKAEIEPGYRADDYENQNRHRGRQAVVCTPPTPPSNAKR